MHTARQEIRVDRRMEYIHMKDMRASGLEPINVLSQYKWQDGLGYYESTKDASTNFFFDNLPKGVYVTHRQIVLHTYGFMSGLCAYEGQLNVNSGDVYMPLTPMFHVHAWGMPYLFTMLGNKQVYPGRFTQYAPTGRPVYL